MNYMTTCLLIALAVVTLGCGTSDNAGVDGGIAGDASAVTASTFFAAIEHAECQQYVRCGFAEDAASCDAIIDSYAGFAQSIQLDSDVADGKVVFNASEAQACVDAVAAASCDQNIGVSGSRDIPAACSDYATGTIADGVACSANDECESGSCLLASQCALNTCCAGTCNTAVAIGGSCSQENSVCGPDGFCDTHNYTCAALLSAESACERSTDCRDGLACTKSICTALPTIGQACNTTDGCQGINLDCSVPDQNTPGTCVTAAARGATCDAAPCKLGSVCDLASATCIALPSVGSPCILGGCAGGSACDNSVSPGRCKALVANGGACSSDDLCISHFCNGVGAPGAVCAAPPVCGN